MDLDHSFSKDFSPSFDSEILTPPEPSSVHLSYECAGGNDDGYWAWNPTTDQAAGYVVNEKGFRVGGFDGNYYNSWVRFGSVEVPKYSRVFSAKLNLYCASNLGTTIKVYIEYNVKPHAPIDAEDANSRMLWTQYTTFVADTPGPVEIDITRQISKIVSHGGWKNGYPILVFLICDQKPVPDVRSKFDSTESGEGIPSIDIDYAPMYVEEGSGGSNLGGRAYNLVRKLTLGGGTYETDGTNMLLDCPGGVLVDIDEIGSAYYKVNNPTPKKIGSVRCSGTCDVGISRESVIEPHGLVVPRSWSKIRITILSKGGLNIGGASYPTTPIINTLVGSANDGYWEDTFLDKTNPMRVGMTELRGAANAYVRFENVDMPRRQIIKNAGLKIYCSLPMEVTAKVYGVYQPDPTPPPGASDAKLKPRTTNYVEFMPFRAGWWTIDVTPVIQEITDQYWWAPGNAIMLYIIGEDTPVGVGFATFGSVDNGTPASLLYNYCFEYDETGNGRIKVGGDKNIAYKVIIRDANGTALIGGSANVKSDMLIEGGVTANGTATIDHFELVPVSGGVTATKIRTLVQVSHNVVAEGGPVMSGLVRPAFAIPIGGGPLVAGQSIHHIDFDFWPEGGLSLSGISINNEFYLSDSFPIPGIKLGDSARLGMLRSYRKIISGVGRTFNNDNLIKSVEEEIRQGVRIIVQQYGEAAPELDPGYRYDVMPTWCDVAKPPRTNYYKAVQQCNGVLPAIVARRQGVYMPAKKRKPTVQDTTIARLY